MEDGRGVVIEYVQTAGRDRKAFQPLVYVPYGQAGSHQRTRLGMGGGGIFRRTRIPPESLRSTFRHEIYAVESTRSSDHLLPTIPHRLTEVLGTLVPVRRECRVVPRHLPPSGCYWRRSVYTPSSRTPSANVLKRSGSASHSARRARTFARWWSGKE